MKPDPYRYYRRLLQDRTFMFIVFVFAFDNIELYLLCIITWFTHTSNIEILCSNKCFDVEISSSNTPPRELYRIILSESNDKTWWWPLPAETCSFFYLKIQHLIRHIQLCYWLHTHLLVHPYTMYLAFKNHTSFVLDLFDLSLVTLR